MNTQDNIAAPATAVGGAVNIIRLSGPGVLDIANKIWQGTPLSKDNVRKMILGKVAGDQVTAARQLPMRVCAVYWGPDAVWLNPENSPAVPLSTAKSTCFRRKRFPISSPPGAMPH